MQFVLIGNPENRRTTYFEEAVRSQGFAAPLILSYMDILDEKVDLAAVLPNHGCLRIDSPGEHFELSRRLLALGAEHPLLGEAQRIGAAAARQLPFEQGRVQYLRQSHLGFSVLLEQLRSILDGKPALRLMNSLDSILLSFDKIRCHQHLATAGISVPAALYDVESYADLREKMAQHGWTRVFIKPINGSSASGVVAYRIQGNKEQAISSAELVRENGQLKIYNSLKISTYQQRDDIQDLIDYLAKESVIVEQWIPKASLGDAVFDFRILVIGGKAQHSVVRKSQSPMTNLHLGNQRGDLDLLKEHIGEDNCQQLYRLAEQAMHNMPDMFYAGIDAMLSVQRYNPYILEINAFGDLLPNIFINGLDSYAATVQQFATRYE